MSELLGEFLPEVGTFVHGKCREMQEGLSKLEIGEKITIDYKIAKDSKSAISKRLGITVRIRKAGEMADVYRVA